jgi:hypothetical protein
VELALELSMAQILIGQSSPDIEFKNNNRYPWRSVNVGTSFFVSKNEVKYTTITALASRTGKRFGRKYRVKVHDKHEHYPEGCYEVACVKLTINPTLNNFEAEKLKYLAPAPVEVVNDPVAFANWQIQAKNARLMDDLQHGRLEPQSHVETEPAEPKQRKPRKSKTEGSDEEFSDAEFEKIKQLPWNKVDEVNPSVAIGNDIVEVKPPKPNFDWGTEFVAQPIKNEE